MIQKVKYIANSYKLMRCSCFDIVLRQNKVDQITKGSLEKKFFHQYLIFTQRDNESEIQVKQVVIFNHCQQIQTHNTKFILINIQIMRIGKANLSFSAFVKHIIYYIVQRVQGVLTCRFGTCSISQTCVSLRS